MFKILTYKEYLDKHKKYDGKTTCFVQGCNKPAFYEGGDARFYCCVCEDHADMEQSYLSYLERSFHKIVVAMHDKHNLITPPE